MKVLIKNGRVLDPSSKTDAVSDVLVEGGKVKKIAKGIKEKADRVIQAKGCFVMPGFIDLHVHLRDPGFEEKETVETGARAAARGGFTTILAMPNTKPAVDNANVVNYVHQKAKNLAKVNVLQIGAVTKGQDGEALSDIHEMVKAGVPALSEDGKSVMRTDLYYRAMEIAREEGIPVFAHCEDKDLARGGVMNAGERAKELKMPGILNEAEDVIVARDILLAHRAGANLHLCHCSTKNSVQLIRLAKRQGYAVTAEACPHHFTLTDADIPGDDANYKMNPPLRAKEDMEALTYSELVQNGYLTELGMAEKLSYRPAQVIGSEKGVLQEGAAADIVVFDPNRKYELVKEDFAGKAKNTPFLGRKVTGKVVCTMVGGEIAYQEESRK